MSRLEAGEDSSPGGAPTFPKASSTFLRPGAPFCRQLLVVNYESRARTHHDRIEINPKIMMGRPVIKASRIMVELILRKMAEGADERALLEAYPHLTREALQAAVRFAAETLAHEEMLPEQVR